jgi:hypothetical protein
VSLYLALNFLVEKSINNSPASSSTPLASNLGFKVFLVLDSKSKKSVFILNSNCFVVGSTDKH